MAEARAFDIILFGATGYTGRLVAEHLLKTYGMSGELRWAIAGRSQEKLAEIGALIGAPSDLPLLVADSADRPSLDAMAARTKVIISTVGPYQLYGDELVAACAAAGTDYVDLTGEPNWIAKMIAAHQETAQRTGARLVFSCGFDSIPFDLGVWFLQKEARARFGAALPRVRGRVRGLKGGLSGGTAASGAATMAAAQKDPSVYQLLLNPFACTPGFEGPQQPNGSKPYFDEAVGSWVGPFMMASINTKAVHRTNFLAGFPYGREFQYDEMLMIPGPEAAGGSGFDASASLPKPGEGPTPEERETGWYDLLFVGEAADGRVLKAAVKGDKDPGYGSTSKMLAEAAVTLASVPREHTPGGCWTAAAAMGEALLQRLPQKAGLTFALED